MYVEGLPFQLDPSFFSLLQTYANVSNYSVFPLHLPHITTPAPNRLVGHPKEYKKIEQVEFVLGTL